MVLSSYPQVHTSRRRRPLHSPSTTVQPPNHRRRIDPAALLPRPASRPTPELHLQSPTSMSRANWTRDLTDVFMSALVDECRAGNRPHKTLNRIGKANVARRMRHYTGRGWTWDTCKHKWDELRRKWSCWKQLTKSSDIRFHPRTALIDMPEHWWDAQIAANKHAKLFRQCRLENEEQLDYVFAKIEPSNVSPIEAGGHEGGRAEVPTQNMQPARLSLLPLRLGLRLQQAEPTTAATGFDLHQPQPQRQKVDHNMPVESDPEYEAFMRELLDGGVDPESEEYFMASEVLLDVRRRGAYRPLPTTNAKVAWIKRVYPSMKGQPPAL